MRVVIVYAEQASHDLDVLERSIAQRIVAKIRFYGSQQDPLKFAKALAGDLRGRYRYRIGDYRVIFRKDDHGHLVVLMVLRISHRKDIYE